MDAINITKMSSKGQIVIPLEMRSHLKEGDKLLLIKNGNNIILKKATEIDENFQEDLEFARRTEEAFKRHERGECIRMDFDEFIEEMKKW